ncbi:serine/threonine-protein kinase [Microbacterium sp. PA5]|uniref:serine/threonine-protein kinase n=1 Tax=Microbacterium sp. PA5 TaxID=3416654 RepID=UPI003CF03999
MSSKRTPAPPPQLPGFTFLEVLGSGGFADVYLFEQHLPRRKIAVKVLLPEKMAGASTEQFTAEANVMALLSTHPAIVTIYQAGVSDDHRPYLAMEYCPKPNLQVRSRAAALSVAEALRIGIQVAAAVETAHRAGILHRDIKPANILVTEYNRPALTDFGIATTAGSVDPSSGMSIPWSPPESFADVPEFGVRSDVWALGATLFTLLAGRSPFEVPGGRNGGAELIQRIEGQSLARLERADAPESLQLVLERSMSKRPADRYESAVAFARALQKVQIELAHSVTPIDILDDSPDADDEDDDDGELTRVRGIVSIDPQTTPAAGRTRERMVDFAPPAAGTSAGTTATSPDETVARVAVPRYVEPDVAATVVRSSPPAIGAPPVGPAPVAPAPTGSAPGGAAATAAFAPLTAGPATPAAPSPAEAGTPRSRAGLWIGLAAGATALAVAGVVAGASLLAPQAAPTPTTPAVVDPQDPVDGYVPPVADLTGTVEGDRAVFTWTNPEPAEGDGYVWYPYTLEGEGEQGLVDTETVSLPVDASGRTCIAVSLRREDGTTGDELRACTP